LSVEWDVENEPPVKISQAVSETFLKVCGNFSLLPWGRATQTPPNLIWIPRVGYQKTPYFISQRPP
jgi:hypothetical protein